jgi:HK97 gp10 family phage protein
MAKRGVRVELIGDKEMHEKLHRMGENVQKANSKAARAAEVPILSEATEMAPGPHIMALQSKRESTEDLAVVDIGPDKEHWFYQFFETGAIAHTIKAKKAKALAFEGRNGLVVIQSVQHPGMQKHPFLKKSLTHNKDLVQEIAGKVFLQEINKETTGD